MNAAKANNSLETPANAPSDRAPEAKVKLPCSLLIAAVVGGAMLVVGLWSIIALLGSLRPDFMISGLVGAAAVGVTAVAGVLVLIPWKARAVADWMTMWLAATVFRLLATPVVVYVLYSAASEALAVKPLVLSVASTYFVTLMAEAAILASHIRRSFPSA